MRRERSPWILLLVLLFGALVGSLVGEVLSAYLPVLGRSVGLGLEPPATLNLFVLTVTFGFRLKANVGSALGILLSLMLWLGRR